MRRQGGEFGTVTGRPRRCGWFDAVAARYAVALNGLTSAVIITKLDVLSRVREPRHRDRLSARRTSPSSFSASPARGLELEIEEMPGWSEPIDDVPPHRRPPAAARRYVDRIGELLGVPIELRLGRPRTLAAGSLTHSAGELSRSYGASGSASALQPLLDRKAAIENEHRGQVAAARRGARRSASGAGALDGGRRGTAIPRWGSRRAVAPHAELQGEVDASAMTWSPQRVIEKSSNICAYVGGAPSRPKRRSGKNSSSTRATRVAASVQRATGRSTPEPNDDRVIVQRLNGQPAMLNCDLIESVEEENDATVVTKRTERGRVTKCRRDSRKSRRVKRRIHASAHGRVARDDLSVLGGLWAAASVRVVSTSGIVCARALVAQRAVLGAADLCVSVVETTMLSPQDALHCCASVNGSSSWAARAPAFRAAQLEPAEFGALYVK